MFPSQPKPELTEHDRLMAALVLLDQRLPGGSHIAAEIQLGKAIQTVDQLFTQHKLPMREQLIAELTAWHNHVRDGIQLMRSSYSILQTVIQTADKRSEK